MVKIIKQSHEILNISHDNPLQFIEMSARNCYQSEVKDIETTKRFINGLIKRKHLTPFENVSVSIKLITSRGIMAELTRHRLCSFNILSTRYVSYKDGIDVVLPVEFYDTTDDAYNYNTWLVHMKRSELAYQDLIAKGCKPQLARSVLPNSLKTQIIMTVNLRELLHIFELRCASTAHPQIQKLMKGVLNSVHSKIPIIFDDLWERFCNNEH